MSYLFCFFLELYITSGTPTHLSFRLYQYAGQFFINEMSVKCRFYIIILHYYYYYFQGCDIVLYGDRQTTIYDTLYRSVSASKTTTTNRERSRPISPKGYVHSVLRYVLVLALLSILLNEQMFLS